MAQSGLAYTESGGSKRIPRQRSSSRAHVESVLERGRQRTLALRESGTLPPGPDRPGTLKLSEDEAQRLHDDEEARKREEHEREERERRQRIEENADEQTAIMSAPMERHDSDYGATSSDPRRLRSRNSQQGQSQPPQNEAPNEDQGGSQPQTNAAPKNETPDDVLSNEGNWFKRQLNKYGTLELENKGSVARDHLALERTFLAWLRTSVTFASIGIAITQLFRLNTSFDDSSRFSDIKHSFRSVGKPIGATFVSVSIVVLFVGFHRYFEGQHWIIRGKFPASRGSVSLIAFIAFALMVASLVVVLVVDPKQFER